jgi:subtilase family serine protease
MAALWRAPLTPSSSRNDCWRFARIAVGGAVLFLLAMPALARTLRIGTVTEVAGREVAVPVQLVAQGDENALSFSLSWNSTLMTFLGDTAAAGSAGASLIRNTNQLASGRLGYALGRAYGDRFATGTNELLRLRFLLGNTVTNTVISFTNTPILLETSDSSANTLSTDYSNSIVTITPLFPPGIVTQPQGLAVQPITNVVTNVTVSVTATGSPPLLFQWRLATTNLSWATNTAMTMTNVTPANSGSYDVVVRNSGGAVTSQVAVVTVFPALIPPAITTQPQNWVASAGESVLFSLAVTGSEPLRYQWRFNTTPMSGETNRSLLLTNVTPARNGNYSCAVTNLGGSATSGSASLTVSATPRLLRIVERSVATSGEVDVPVELVALGDENAVGFSLAFDPSRLTFVSASAGAGASGASLLANTSEASAGRVGVALVRGTGERFAAGAAAAVQMRFRAANTSGATPLAFTNRPVAIEVGDIWSMPRPVAWSNGVVNILATAPAIVTQPQSTTNTIFTTATFSLTASGSQPLSYQWQFNGTNLPGANSATLVLSGVRPGQSGDYRVIVTNPVAAVTSLVATLTVPRVIRVAGTNAPTGNLVDVPLQLLANGDENAAGFSLRFDPARLTFREIVSNSVAAGATLNVNTNSAAGGSLGLAVAQSFGNSFAVGTQRLAMARFLVNGTAGETLLTFADQPVVRELGDNTATSLLTEFQPGAITALLVPPLVTLQPQPQDVLQGTPVSFSVAARGSLPITFQWQRNGADLPRQTNTTLTLPNVLLSDSGSYSVRCSSAAGVIYSASAILTVRPPPADLLVTQFVPPTEVVAGQPLTLWWAISNAGTQTAQGPWQDRVFIADNPQGQGGRVLGNFTFFTSLATNQWLTHTGVVIVPPELTGTRFFGVMADSGYQVPESNETNNTFMAAASEVSAPDLALRLLTSAPTGMFGGSISVTWAVTNVGTAAARGAWNDRLYLSASSNSLASATVLATTAGVAPLVPEAGYHRTVSVTLPNSAQLAAGTYFLATVTDFDSALAESAEDNNSLFAAIVLTQPPRPDLSMAQVIVPASAIPGKPFTLVWSVTNSGSVAATGTWSDSVRWSNSVSGEQELARFDFTNGLSAGASAWRTQAVTLPINGPAGQVWLGVQADGLDEVAEENEANNCTRATNATVVPLVLTLQLPLTQIAEDAVNPIFNCTVVRNGDLTAALTVSLTSSDTNGVSLPVSVVIPAGQSGVLFPARVIRDYVVTGPRTVRLTASAPGRSSSQRSVMVLNADLPRLSLTLATNTVVEGASLSVIVSRDVVTTNPVPVVLQSSSPSRFSPPTFVTIPGGASATNFNVLAVDNNTVEAFVVCELSSTATGFDSAAASITILDNDLPGVWVTLANATVSEGAGPQATLATVTRSILSSRSLGVDLVSTNPAAAMVPARVVIPANQLSVAFPVAAVNDDHVSGPKTTYIRPFVLDTVGSTRLYEGSGALLTVTDDDGPTLKLVAAKKLVPEGQSPATTLTVFRNTPATNILVVTLVSSDLTEATVPATVTIPAGTNAATAPLASIADGITDGNQTVVLTASAPGYVAGTETVVVSDTDLPDLVVTTVTAPATAETDSYVSVGYRVVNQGLGSAGTNFLMRVYLSKDQFGSDKVLVSQAPFDGTIPVGLFFEQTLQVRLPQAADNYWAVVEADAAQQIAEVFEDNNTRISATPIVSRAAYGAWVQTSLTNVLANTPVPLSGRATNSLGVGVPSKLVNLHILTRGTMRVISALTDSGGNFATTWQPLPGEAGFYQIFATHPGVSSVPVQDEFRLVGMRANPASVDFKAVEGSSSTGSVAIENLSDLPLTGLSVTVVSQSAGLQVGVNLTGGGTMAGGGTAALSYTVLPTTAQAYGNVVIRVSSAQGASVDVTLAVSVEPLRPRLVATPGNLVAGMARGRQAVVEFKLANEGGIPTGPIVIALPSVPWLTLATTNPLPPLLPGETNGTTITLLLTPAADLTLGAYEGSLALNSSNASLTVPFNFRALSEAKGDLRITAVDELTYYAVGMPNLAGASVAVRDAVTHTNVATGVTDTNGQFFVAQLPEAYYEIELMADKHTTYRNTHLLMAGRTNDISAFLSRQVVTYNWTVEPIEIEDRYQITIETTFETVVPIPVVTIEPSVIDLAEITAAETQIMVTITNHGLLAANNTRLSFPTHPLWEFYPLLTQVGTLPARSGLRIPLIIRKLAPPVGVPALSRAAKDGDLGPCYTSAYVCWDLVCGPLTNTYCGTVYFPNARPGCGGTPPSSGGGGPIGGGGGGGTYVSTPSYSPPYSCNPCVQKLIEAIAKCVWKFIPFPDWFKCGENSSKCVLGLTDGLSWGAAYKCAKAGIYCAKVAGKTIPGPWKYLKYLECTYDIVTACDGLPSAARANSVDLRRALKDGSGVSLSELESLKKQARRLKAVFDYYTYVLGDVAWMQDDESTLSGDWLEIFEFCIDEAGDDGPRLSLAERAQLLALPRPSGVSTNHAARFIERWNRTVDYWQSGIFYSTNVPAGQSGDFIAVDVWTTLAAMADDAILQSQTDGYPNIVEGIESETSNLLARLTQGASGGVCARVKLRTEQEAVVTRDAFRATLEINNQDTARLENIEVTLTVTDANGVDRTSLFGVRVPDLVGLSGVDGTGILAGVSLGTAKWVIIPTSEAAPTNSTQYYVSGRFRYTQSGTALSVPLAAVAITVLPTPRLFVDYFHERDVFSDDPFTDMVEPSIPFNLAVMIRNKGYGLAKNFRITSAQPQIVENEKGLLIDFQIIATDVAGRNMVPSLTAEFGDIGPGQKAIGRWLMTSTLQGLFTDYKATFEHLDAIGGVKLSLLEDVKIHEMIHLVQAGGSFEDGKPDFLVNDIPDLRDLPDTLWLSDGTTNPVAVVEAALHDGPPAAGRLQVQLSAAMPGGWAYLRVPEPSGGLYRLTEVRRSDGAVVRLDKNVLVTDRTFIGLGRRPIRENILHLLDYNSTGLYTLTYEVGPAGDTTPPVSQVAPLPPDSYRRIPVSWSGQDEPGGSGLANFDIQVSVDGGTPTNWLARTTLNSSVYFGTFGHSYAFTSRARDTAGNLEALHTTLDAITAVTLTNRPPMLTSVTNQFIDEGSEFTLALAASDADPADALTFSLTTSPSGMSINPYTGLIRWTTSESTGPSTNPVVARVQDNGDPSLAATAAFTLVVREVNSAPLLAAITNRTINEGQLLLITNVVTDYDLPPNKLMFSLGGTRPTGAAINATNGIFRWQPTETQGPTTNLITVIVTDAGVPSLSATQQFLVIVRDSLSDFEVIFGSTNLMAGEVGSISIVLRSSLDLTNISLQVVVSGTQLTNLSLSALGGEIVGASLISTGANLTRVRFLLDPAQMPASVRTIAALDFLAVSNYHSARVFLDAGNLLAWRAIGNVITNGATVDGSIIVIGREPWLESRMSPEPQLLIYGRPGAGYALEYRTNLASAGPWTEWLRLTQTNRLVTLENPPLRIPGSFWRAFEFRAEPPKLAWQPGIGTGVGLRLSGWPGTAYGVETTTAITNPPIWQSWTNFALTNTSRMLLWPTTAEPQRFFRGLSR